MFFYFCTHVPITHIMNLLPYYYILVCIYIYVLHSLLWDRTELNL